MAVDPKVLELQKLIQLSGQNGLKLTGEMTNDPNDPTRIALANINKAQGFGKGIGAAANTVETQNYLNQFKDKLNPQPTVTNSTQEVKQVLADKPTQPTPVTDNSNLINSQYSNLIGALKGQIQQSINNKNQQIANTPQQYQPLKNQNDVNRAQNLKSVLEQSINSGDRGGNARMAALNVNTSRDNVLNDINLQQENAINSLKNDVANLVLQGDIESANLQAQKLQQLIANNQYVDQQNYNRSQDQFNNGLSLANLLGTYNGQRTLAGQNFDQGVLESNRNYNRNVLESDRAYNYQVQQDELNRKYQQQQDAINNAFQNRQISNSERNSRLNQAEFDYRKEKDTLDRQEKANQPNTDAYKSYQSQIERMQTNMASTQEIIQYIQNLENNGVPGPVIDQLLMLNGFPTGR